LLAASIGVLGTLVGGLGGVLITQRRADHREREAWQRELERERERWEREDVTRTFEHHREACLEFFGSLRAAQQEARHIRRHTSADTNRLDAIEDVLIKQFVVLRLYASSDLIWAPSHVLDLVARLRASIIEEDDVDVGSALQQLSVAENKLIRLIRKELAVTATPPGQPW
jgi:hypothetical protein